ncbi:MAG: hypothetical protein ACP5E3_05920, partial [Bacteroidales bacterium]
GQSVSFSKTFREKFLLPADRSQDCSWSVFSSPGFDSLFRRISAGSGPLSEDSFSSPSERAAFYRSLGLTNV